MNKIIRTAAMAALVAFGLAGTAQAQDLKPYVGAGIGVFNLDAGFGSANAVGAFIDGGVDVNQYLAAELRVGTTGKASVTYFGIPIDSSIDYFVSYLGKLQYPVSDQLSAYALLGGTTLKTKLSAAGINFSNTSTDFTFGIGAQYQFAPQLKAGLEWVQYANDANLAAAAFPGLNASSLSVTINYNF